MSWVNFILTNTVGGHEVTRSMVYCRICSSSARLCSRAILFAEGVVTPKLRTHYFLFKGKIKSLRFCTTLGLLNSALKAKRKHWRILHFIYLSLQYLHQKQNCLSLSAPIWLIYLFQNLISENSLYCRLFDFLSTY